HRVDTALAFGRRGRPPRVDRPGPRRGGQSGGGGVMTHLGERMSALVDGELDHAERDRLLGHVADCQPCRSELDLLRKIKARLARSTGPEMSPTLLSKLLAMAEPGGPPPAARRPVARPRSPIHAPARTAARDAS